MPKHFQRLLLLIFGFIVVALVAKSYFTPDSFYEFGHYRSDSVREIAADTPKFKGADYCEGCHNERHVEWSSGVHKTVKCEVCHGPARTHPENVKLTIPTNTVKLCTLCHEAMPTRPAAQPQIVVSDHAGTAQCTACHKAHSPKIGGAAPDQTAAATTESRVSQCVGCHGPDGLGVGDFPPLAGKGAGYLDKQMRDYRSGARKHEMMNTIAKALSDEDISDLAAYYAALKGGKGK